MKTNIQKQEHKHNVPPPGRELRMQNTRIPQQPFYFRNLQNAHFFTTVSRFALRVDARRITNFIDRKMRSGRTRMIILTLRWRTYYGHFIVLLPTTLHISWGHIADMCVRVCRLRISGDRRNRRRPVSKTVFFCRFNCALLWRCPDSITDRCER